MTDNFESRNRLRDVWPKVFQALTLSYYPGTEFGRTYAHHMNDAGYIHAGLTQFEKNWQKLHGHYGLSHAALDEAAAREIAYHWRSGRRFRRAAAALSTAICNLVHERPEAVMTARRNGGVRHAG